MNVIFSDMNTVNYIAIAIVFILIIFFYAKKIQQMFYDDNKLSGIKIKRPLLTKQSIKNLEVEITEFEEYIEQLNADFLSGDKVAQSNFSNRLDMGKKKYLEMFLRIESFLNQKKQIEKEKIDITQFDDLKSRVEYVKKILDLLVEEQSVTEQKKHGKSLKVLAVVEILFLPLGVLTGYFGMNFSSMGDPGDPSKGGLYSMKYGQLFMFGLSAMFLMLLFYILGPKFFTHIEHFSDYKELDKLQEHHNDLMNPPQPLVRPWQYKTLNENSF